MTKFLAFISKDGMTVAELQHWLLLILGVFLVGLGGAQYEAMGNVLKVLVLIVYLGALIGVAPVALPIFRITKNPIFNQCFWRGLNSAYLDSYIVLEETKELKTCEAGQDLATIAAIEGEQDTGTGERAKLLSVITINAIIGGLVLWFGEVYAAPLYQSHDRTGWLSALYIVPPVLIFLTITSAIAAKYINIQIVETKGHHKGTKRDLVEFAIGIVALLFTHNPLVCLGALMIYSFITRQDHQLLDVIVHKAEINVMIVLFIAMAGGMWLIQNVIAPAGFATGEFAPIIPSGVQAVLWGALYSDPDVTFWIQMTNLSTGALFLPISSLVGVMLFRTWAQWKVYMRYSFAAAGLWYGIMRLWIWATLETPVGEFLDQWAKAGGH